MIVAAFENEAAADDAYNQLKRSANNPWLDDVAVIVHHGHKVKIKESRDMGGGKGAVVGGAIGALTGLLFPPALLLTTAAGAVIGGIGAKLHDANLASGTLKHLGEGLSEGSAAIVAVVNENLVPQATDALKRLGATVSTEGLDADTVSRLKTAHDAETPGSGSGSPPAK
jgi:uncharacterized membrane protein